MRLRVRIGATHTSHSYTAFPRLLTLVPSFISHRLILHRLTIIDRPLDLRCNATAKSKTFSPSQPSFHNPFFRIQFIFVCPGPSPCSQSSQSCNRRFPLLSVILVKYATPRQPANEYARGEQQNKPKHPEKKSIHTDVWGPSHTLNLEGRRYYVTFTDDTRGRLGYA